MARCADLLVEGFAIGVGPEQSILVSPGQSSIGTKPQNQPSKSTMKRDYEFKRVTERIDAVANKEHGSGATEDQLRATEDSLRLVIPSSYKEFLRRYGWAESSTEHVYGVGGDVPIHLDLVRNTHTERSEAHPLLPPFLLPVMNDGAGNHYCLDTRAPSDQEAPVVLWNHELGADQTLESLYDSFHFWLSDLLDRIGSNA